MLLVTGARAGSLLPTAHSAAVSGVVSIYDVTTVTTLSRGWPRI